MRLPPPAAGPALGPAVILVVALALLASGCAGRYARTEHYTSREGVPWSCREPAPHPGGHCRAEAEWPR